MPTIIVNPGDNLQSKIDGASAGDTLSIHAATYLGGKHNLDDHGAMSGQFCCFYVSKSLTFQSFGDGTPVLTYDPNNLPFEPNKSDGVGVGMYGNVFYITAGTPCTFDTVEIIGMGSIPHPPAQGDNACINFNSDNGASGSIVRNCTLHEGNFGIVVSSSGDVATLIEKNKIYNIGLSNPDTRFQGIYCDGGGATTRRVIRYNHVYQCSGYGIQMYSNPARWDVYGNVVHHCAGFIVVTGDGHNIYSNTFAMSNYVGALLYSTNTVFQNNIMFGATGGNYPDYQWVQPGYASATDGYNAYRTHTGITIKATDKIGDPQFKSANAYDSSKNLANQPAGVLSDFSLLGYSPCINTGTTLGAPYNVILDPTSTNLPPPLTKTNANPTEIGAFWGAQSANPNPGSASSMLLLGVGASAPATGTLNFSINTLLYDLLFTF